MTQNLKFKIKEFEWFEMETKVRQIIQEVLGPMQKRILESSNTIHKLKINQAEDEDKINQITLMIANDPKVFETGVFQAVEHRFEEQSKHIEELSRQITEGNKYVDEKFKILDIRMEESSEVLRNVASLRERISKEIQLQNDNINHLRTNIEKMIDAINTDVREVRSTVQLNLQSCEKQDYSLVQSCRLLRSNMDDIQAAIDSHRELHRQKNIRLEEQAQDISRSKEQIEQLQESKILTKKLQEFVKHMQNQLCRAQFKIDNIAPLITQAQISECLYYVLPNKLRKKVAVHEYRKYYQLNRQVLEKNFRDVNETFKGLTLLEEMQKKNTKQIVQLKRKKLLAMGIDIDHLTYEQRERYYSDMPLDEVADDEEDEVKVSNKVDEKQIIAVIDNHMKAFTEGVSEKVKIELGDAKKYLYGVEEELKQEISSYDRKYSQIRKECQTFQTEQLLENKFRGEASEEAQRSLAELRNQCRELKEIQRLFYNFCSLVNHLQIQDQIDKQNISLMGVQEKSDKAKYTAVQLDKKCFSCCGYPASTLSAFKMACLTYSPSIIHIDNKEYKRQELLQFTTNMLHSIKKGMQDLEEQKTPSPKLKDSMDSEIGLSRVGRLETEEVDSVKKTENKFRKTRKFVNNQGSVQKGSSMKTKAKSNSFLRDDMLNVTSAFMELRRKNLAFLA